MKCPLMNDLVHAYLDGELSLTEQLNFEQHMTTCPQCEQAHRAFLMLRQKLQQPDLRFEVPADLRQKILNAAPPIPEPPKVLSPVRRSFLPRLIALAAMIAILATGVSAWLMQAGQPSLANELVDAHIRSLQADHLTDVASTDQHTVKPWFDGKLDFAPPVVDLAAKDFPLIGGRLDYLRDHPTAALVYRHRKHVINVFVWPESGEDQSPRASAVNGYQLIQWRHAGMREAAVSDLNATELRQFVDELR